MVSTSSDPARMNTFCPFFKLAFSNNICQTANATNGIEVDSYIPLVFLFDLIDRKTCWLMSVLRIEDVTALYLLPTTKGLKNFKNWRKFPCYCDIVLFKYPSGISIIGISKVTILQIKK